jgi:hypothetical protein
MPPRKGSTVECMYDVTAKDDGWRHLTNASYHLQSSVVPRAKHLI